MKVDKISYDEIRNDEHTSFDDLLKCIDEAKPIRLSDPVPKHIKSSIVGFCHMCGAGRTQDTKFCHYCGIKFDMSKLNEVISLHNTGGQSKFEW